MSEVQLIGQPIAYHPLSLRLISGFVKNDPELSNNLVAAVDYDPTGELIAKREHILARAFNSLPNPTQELLSRLSAFFESVTINEIKALASPTSFPDSRQRYKNIPYIASLDLKPITEISSRLNMLHSHGLIQKARHQNRTLYFLHPIIRSYAYKQSDHKDLVHFQLIQYYLWHTQYQLKQKRTPVTKLSDLNNQIQTYLHMIQTGQLDKAFELLVNVIDQDLRFNLGNYSFLNWLIAPFLSKEEKQYTKFKDKINEMQLLVMLSGNHLGMGRPNVALHIGLLVHSMTQKEKFTKGHFAIQGMLSKAYLQLGELQKANWHCEYEVEFFKLATEKYDLNNDKFELAIARQELGYLQAIFGNWEEANEEFDAALTYFLESQREQSEFVVYAYQTFSLLQKGDAQAALLVGQKAYNIAANRHNLVDRIRIEWLLGWVYLEVSDLKKSQEHLDEALNRCRSLNYIPFEPSILLAFAKLAFKVGDKKVAYENLQDAQYISEQATYRLNLADIHNFMAELDIDSGDYSKAKENADKAQSYASFNEHPYIYYAALLKTNQLLTQLENLK